MQAQKIFRGMNFFCMAVLIMGWWSITAAFAQNKATKEEKKSTPVVKTLDGKSFFGKIGEKGKTDGFGDDQIIFKDGKFRSTACDKFGYGEGEYTTTVKKDTTFFETTTISPKDGTMKWKGFVKGNAVYATSLYSKGGKLIAEYWVKGELKK